MVESSLFELSCEFEKLYFETFFWTKIWRVAAPPRLPKV